MLAKTALRVALAALHRSVRPGQRKLRFRVIENCIRPAGCGVALCAIQHESRRRMVRIVGSLVIAKVTT